MSIEKKIIQQMLFMLGAESLCDVMTIQDKHEMIEYLKNYDSDENYRYVFLSDGITEEQLFRYSCTMQQLLIDFKKMKKCNRVLHKQVSFEEYQLIKNNHEVITIKTI